MNHDDVSGILKRVSGASVKEIKKKGCSGTVGLEGRLTSFGKYSVMPPLPLPAPTYVATACSLNCSPTASCCTPSSPYPFLNTPLTPFKVYIVHNTSSWGGGGES